MHNEHPEGCPHESRRGFLKKTTAIAALTAASPVLVKAAEHDEFIAAYGALHSLGWAHSVEVFDRAGQLAGGLYGLRIGGLFAGESMFHAQRDASKVALVALVQLMRDTGLQLLDVQWCTEHLASLGAIEVSRADYLARLAAALASR